MLLGSTKEDQSWDKKRDLHGVFFPQIGSSLLHFPLVNGQVKAYGSVNSKPEKFPEGRDAGLGLGIDEAITS